MTMKNEGARYLNEWMPRQKAKRLRSVRTSTPSDSAKIRLSKGLAGCMRVDIERDGDIIDHAKLSSPATMAPYLQDVFAAYVTQRNSMVYAFKQA